MNDTEAQLEDALRKLAAVAALHGNSSDPHECMVCGTFTTRTEHACGTLAVLADPASYLSARDAAVRAAERERIAQAIEAEAVDRPHSSTLRFGLEAAAHIARTEGDPA